jgi:hypothetical protein
MPYLDFDCDVYGMDKAIDELFRICGDQVGHWGTSRPDALEWHITLLARSLHPTMTVLCMF